MPLTNSAKVAIMQQLKKELPEIKQTDSRVISYVYDIEILAEFIYTNYNRGVEVGKEKAKKNLKRNLRRAIKSVLR